MKKVFSLLFILALTSIASAKIATHDEQSIDYDLDFQIDQSDVEVRDIASDKEQDQKIEEEQESERPKLKRWKY